MSAFQLVRGKRDTHMTSNHISLLKTFNWWEFLKEEETFSLAGQLCDQLATLYNMEEAEDAFRYEIHGLFHKY